MLSEIFFFFYFLLYFSFALGLALVLSSKIFSNVLIFFLSAPLTVILPLKILATKDFVV